MPHLPDKPLDRPAPSTPGRQARLKPQYAALYPDIPPDTWTSAANMSQTLLGGFRNREGRPAVVEVRLLDNEHFEFQGGERHQAPGRKSRKTDRV